MALDRPPLFMLLGEVGLMMLSYGFFFLLPLALPVVSYVSLVPVVVGVIVLPFARSLLFREKTAGRLVLAAALSGLLFTGFYLAAIDSAMRGAHGATWHETGFLRSLLVFSLSPYGIIGGVVIGLVAYAGHYFAIMLRAFWVARDP
jgi:hypothetical protein